MTRLRREVKAVLHEGPRCGCKTTGRTYAEVPRIEEGLWTFARVEGVPPTGSRGATPWTT